MPNKKMTKDFKQLMLTARKINKFTKGQEVVFDLLLSMVSVGDITECQASYTLGILVAKGEDGIKGFVEEQRQKIKEEVNKND